MKKLCTRTYSLLLIILTLSVAAPSFAQGIQQLADRMEIAEVIAKYSYYNDYPNPDDAEAYAALYTEDAFVEGYVLNETEPFFRIGSQAEILAGAKNRRPGNSKSGHHQSGLIFMELTENTAQTRVMVLLSRQGADETIPSIVSAGTYYDTWSKTTEGWKIAARVLRIDGPN
jgi:hypothetical protein